MSEKTNSMVEAMKTQTIGVEIEMADITREAACRVVAKHFGTENTVRYEGGAYKTWSCKDPQGRRWAITRDSSIKARTDDEKSELGTPILTYADIEDLQQIVRDLRKAKAVSDPIHGCGVHVHIGANGHDARTLRNLTNIMASHEDLLIDAINIAESRTGTYCKVTDRRFLERLNKKKPDTMAKLADIWYEENHATYGRNRHYNESRYHMLNLHATFTKGTVEFRLFQFDNPTAERKGGLHAGQLKAYIQLCLALSQSAKTARSASPAARQTDNPKYAMRTWLLRLGFIGEEFATAREMLTRRLDGDAAFRNGRPAAN